MNIVVTGYRGFIGTKLADKLLRLGHEVAGLDKKEGHSTAILKNAFAPINGGMPDPDIIVHLGASCSTARSLDDPLSDFTDNAVGTINVCEFARRTQTPVLYTSTCKVYPNPQGLRTPYGVSKLIGEMYLNEYNAAYGVEYIINRPGTIYGPDQQGSPESGWVSWFINASQHNSPITVYGDGNQTRDLLYVDDYVDLLIDQIDHFDLYKNRTYDVGGGIENEVSLLQLLGFLKYRNFEFAPERLGDVKRFVSDNKAITAVNGWRPRITWQEGMVKAL